MIVSKLKSVMEAPRCVNERGAFWSLDPVEMGRNGAVPLQQDRSRECRPQALEAGGSIQAAVTG
jgi:hypothetical protein